MGKLIKGNLAWIAKGKRYVPKSSIPVEVGSITAFDHVWARQNQATPSLTLPLAPPPVTGAQQEPAAFAMQK